ncbi:TetR/AcrR family transcriptional regulator [Aquabacter sp. P-9]|uniref:TetR/AcrR family transcriptional regulator n=1 Tax=Aquabacter sediminis TaxID=3029197 RepID=UPI00237D8318|nr:TetR/AcrR family transcriptional regulator [Aquabacter sp. P-9]MDE1569418.1 TetR/AcrR family transcriptional regulator [Aquabacter sp. P-9]
MAGKTAQPAKAKRKRATLQGEPGTGGAAASAGAARTHRLSAQDRRRDILEKSIAYFAQVGFDGGTRELARHLGTTQPLLYRYFPNKDALIQEIYKVVYLDQWRPAWDALLEDRTRPLRERLQVFYEEYTDVILTPHWMRIYFFAGLKGVPINERYLALVEERILTRIIREFHHACGLPVPATVSPEDLEIAWDLQGGIFYYGVRKYVYRSPVHVEKPAMIAQALDVFFAGYKTVLSRRNGL